MIDKEVLGEGPWLHMKGGYTDTYICSKKGKVVKFCDKYHYVTETEAYVHAHTFPPMNIRTHGQRQTQSQLYTHTPKEPIIHYSTICDLVFSKAFTKLRGFPHTQHFNLDSDEKKVRIEMEYLGKTLHDAAHIYSVSSRWKLLPYLIEEISLQCFNMLYNGIQHTDIKPGNILIDPQSRFHVIDFNCMSTYLFQKDTHMGWCYGLGTYQYVAPEILFSSKPHDNSMVWSIAMVALYWLLGYYPISDERMKKYMTRIPEHHHEWKKLMTKLRQKYPSSMQLEKKHLDILGDAWRRLQPMLHWNPNKRWSLQTVLQVYHIDKPVSSIHVKNLLQTVDPSAIPHYVRSEVIEKGHRFLKTIQQESLLVSSVMLFDRCYRGIVEKTYPSTLTDPHLLFLCCWAIHGYLTNRFLFDDDTIIFSIHQEYHIMCNTIINHIYVVGMYHHFDTWQKEWFLLIRDINPTLTNTWTPDWDYVKQLLLQKTAVYNSNTIAEEYIDYMQSQP